MTNFRGNSALLAGAMAMLAMPAVAQQAAPPPAVVPPVMVPQMAPAPAPIPLPRLSPVQSQQLVAMLGENGFAQGLHHDDSNAVPPADNDSLVRAALDYARAVHSGRLDVTDFRADWGLRPAAYDPLPAFADAVNRDRLAQWIASLPPPYSGYDGLAKGLLTYRQLEAAGGWPKLAAGPDLALGASGARVTALRTRLAFEDPLVVKTGDKFDAELKEAVQRAQKRYGLNPTGVLAAQTLAALNVPAGDRVRQIMANMERWRWLPQEMPANRIQVNVAAAVLTVFEGDRPIMSMKAVTGKPGTETPMLSSRIHSVVVNPPWNVPAGIAARELFPKGAAYLARNGFKVIGTGAGRRLQQQPSHSALGKYKFDFDNPYAVYLHDTPSQATFSRYDRLASHGCIRLEKPADLARLLLRNDLEWTPEKIAATVAAGKTVRVPLKQQPIVFLLYWTAFASSDGGMNFRADPYGWDKLLAAKIEARSATQATAVAAR